MSSKELMHIHTIQPYLVLETQGFYQKIIADCGISHFYTFKSNKNQDKVIPIFADACSNLFFAYSSNSMESFFLGNTDNKINFTLKKDTDYFCVRFQPGANPCFENQEVKNLISKEIPLKEFNVLENLSEKMFEQNTFTTRMCTFMEEYRNFLTQNPNQWQRILFNQIMFLIVKNDGLLKVKNLEKLTGYSARYINHLFENNIGMSAKLFSQTVKMHTIVNKINHTQIQSLANLSTDYKFYDQAHFVHSFKEFTGITPGQYIEKIKNSDYSSQIITEK